MFSVRNNAPSYKAHLTGILHRFPAAHRKAAEATLGHVRDKLTDAADQAGWDPEDALGLSWHRDGTPWITVAHSESGDRVFNHEFGHLGQAPNPVLRNSVRGLREEAKSIYTSYLHRHLGLS
jgi:hypothetical protein